MANETSTTTITEIIQRESYQSAAYAYQAVAVMPNLVTRSDLSGRPTLTARFPIFNSLSAEPVSEGTDYSTNQAIDTGNSVDVTVSEHIVRLMVTDLSEEAATVDLARVRGIQIGKAMAERVDKDITALFSGFDTSIGSDSGDLTVSLFQQAVIELEKNNIPRPYYAVLHPKQWGDLIGSLASYNTFGETGEEVIKTGRVGRLHGVDIYISGNIPTATVNENTVYSGSIFNPEAIAFAVKGKIPTIEVQRDASLRAFEVIGIGIWGEAEYRGGAATNGIGGAGVNLYSNATS
jgi:hypothetical protein